MIPSVQSPEKDEIGSDEFEKIISSISNLRDQNKEMERIINQSIIAIRQYENDCNAIKKINQFLSFSIHRFNNQSQSLPLSSQPATSNTISQDFKISTDKKIDTQSSKVNQNPSNISSPQESNHIENENSSSYSSDMSILSHVNIQTEIESQFPNFNNSTIKLRYALHTKTILCSIKYNSDGSLFAFADGKTAFIMNSEEGSLVSACDIPNEDNQNDPHTRCILFSPDSRYLVVSGTKNTIIIINISDSSIAAVLNGHEMLASKFVFTKDSKKLISGGFDGKIIVWDMETFKSIKIIEPTIPQSVQNNNANDKIDDEIQKSNDNKKMITGLVLAHDESFLAVAFLSGIVGIYELTFTQPIKTYEAHTQYLFGLSISPDDSILSTSSDDKTIKLWSVGPVIKCIKTLTGHSDFVLSSTFSPNGKFLFSGSKDERVACWDVESGSLLYYIKNSNNNTIFQLDHHPSKNTFIYCSANGHVISYDYTY